MTGQVFKKVFEIKKILMIFEVLFWENFRSGWNAALTKKLGKKADFNYSSMKTFGTGTIFDVLPLSITLIILSKPVDVVYCMDVLISSISCSGMSGVQKLSFSYDSFKIQRGNSWSRIRPMLENNLWNSIAISRWEVITSPFVFCNWIDYFCCYLSFLPSNFESISCIRDWLFWPCFK